MISTCVKGSIGEERYELKGSRTVLKRGLGSDAYSYFNRLAIADLEIKAATLEAARAELERLREEEKVNLGEKVLRLVLDYEAAQRQVELVRSRLTEVVFKG